MAFFIVAMACMGVDLQQLQVAIRLGIRKNILIEEYLSMDID